MHLIFGKLFHRLLVIDIGGLILLFIPYDVGINKRFFPGIQRIIVSEIHPDHLGKYLLIIIAHGFDIVFIEACNPDLVIHGQTIPAEIFFFSGSSFHHHLTDGLQHLITWKMIITTG